MPGYAAIANHNNKLIRKGVQGSVFIAPATAAAVSATTLFDSTTGAIKTLPAGYVDLGWLTDAGTIFNRKTTQTDILAWGSNDPQRSDVTADVTTIDVICQETKAQTMALGANVAASTVTGGVNGVVNLPHSSTVIPNYYRLFCVMADNGDGGEIIVAKHFPRVSVTAYGAETYSNGATAYVRPFTFTAYPDSTVGATVIDMYGGPGFLYLQDAEDEVVTLTCTVALTTTLTATVGTFTAADVGRTLTGAGIPVGTTIATFTDATHVVMSAAGTVAASGVSVTMQ